MVPLKHGKAEQFIRLGNILSFGTYTHREKVDPQVESRLYSRAASPTTRVSSVRWQSLHPRVEVVWNLDEVRRSLNFIADHGAEVGSSATQAAATIFLRTEDDETRRVCLDSLSRINNRRAKDELLRISQDKHLDPIWKERVLSSLREQRPTSPTTAAIDKSRAERSGQQ